MKQHIKEKWIKALKSGQFQQGDTELYAERTNCYCCLGVLVEAVTGHPPTEGDKQNGTEYLSDDWLARTELDPHEQILLAEMNDGRGDFLQYPQTFEQIADYIEKNL